MNYKDHWVTDSEGKRFVFTVEMQRALSEAGMPVEPDSVASIPAPAGRNDSDRRRSEPKAASVQREKMEEPDSIQIDPQTGKYLGRLKWFNPTKGYGFIARGGGEDIFFHKTSAAASCDVNDLQEGNWVLYDVEERKKGLEAAEVEMYEGEL